MATDNDTSIQKPVLTLEDIAQRKAELHSEIKVKNEILIKKCKDIFAPMEEAETRSQFIVQRINAAMAVFDGFMLGIKVMKKIRNFLRK